MKHAWCLTLLLCASGGCVTLPTTWGEKKTSPPAPAAAPVKSPRPVVSEQINEDNAHEKAAALMTELERDTRKK